MNDNEIKAAAEAAKVALETTTIYDDAFKPAALQIGKSLETVTKSINVALAPLKGLVWGYEQFEIFLKTKVALKLQGIPEERIQEPNLYVVGPALEALRFTTEEQESLQNLFANLLANSLDTETAHKAHPSFVDIIKNLSPDEGKILTLFIQMRPYPIIDIRLDNKDKKGGYMEMYTNISLIGIEAECQHKTLCPNYIENLCRLGLLTIPSGAWIEDNSIYEEIENLPELIKLKELAENITFKRKLVKVTNYGKQFIEACVKDKTQTNNIDNPHGPHIP